MVFAVIYLLFPSIQYATLFDFHAETLVAPLLLYTLYFFQRRHWLWFALFLMLSLMGKEPVSLVVAAWGLVLILWERRWRMGASLMGLGVIWFAVSLWVVIPHFTGGEVWFQFSALYPHLGGQEGASGILQTLFTRPDVFLTTLFSVTKLGYVLLILVPVGFLSFLHWPTLLIASPVFIINLLGRGTTVLITNQRASIIVPFVLLSALTGIGWVAQRWARQQRPGEGKNAINPIRETVVFSLSVFVLSTSLLSNFFFSWSPLSLNFWRPGQWYHWANVQAFQKTSHDAVIDQFVALIPPQVPVSVSPHIHPKLSL